MLKEIKSCLQVLLLALATVIWSGFAAAEESPRDLVVRVTNQVLEVIRSTAADAEAGQDSLNRKIGTILKPVVAFDYISHGVMGDFARQASAEQKARFTKVFQANLISTYTKGLEVYANLDIETLPLSENLANAGRVSIVQKVRGEGSEYTVVYSLGISKVDNQWKLLNVIINGVNLGSTFRSQFAQAMKKHGDLDAVIDNWSG